MENASPEATLQYAQALRQNGKYEAAKAQFVAYGNKQGNNASPAQQQLWIASCDSAIYWMKNPKTATISNQKNLNSERSDWGAGMYKTTIVFASDRSQSASNKKVKKPFLRLSGWESPSRTRYDWTGNGYLSLYTVNGNDSAQRFPLNVASDYHVGPASFTADGKQVYFTLTRIPKKMSYTNLGKNSIATIHTEIYFSSTDETGKWSSPVPFNYNNVELYSVGDPFITKDGNKLYFVSNMPGGQGGTDVYYIERNANQEWGTPISLKEVNTAGDERTPSLGDKGNFYFASDGRIGMGGLDIFSAKISSAQKVTNIQNMGYPTNSPQDDFFFTSTGKLTGFLSSNRTGGLGSDDIYSFTEKEFIIVKPAYSLEGSVLNKETNQVIKGANLQLTSGGTTVKAVSGENGEFQFKLAEQTGYSLVADKAGYMRSSTASLTTVGLNKSAVLRKDLYLSEIVIGKAIKIDNIFYNFDKFNIRPDAALELDKLVAILNENPTIWIELGSHTDSRGNDAYNQKLSQNRANAAVAYILSKGIAKERITAKGYGETVLVNGCKNGLKCT
jgi:peptidoglycan-associated lipoprotein